MQVDLGDGRSVVVAIAGPEGAPPVVLIHGALVDRADMALTLGARLARRFRVYVPDRPGHGDSRRPRLAASPWAQATAIRQALERLGVERPAVIGHSFGGAVALAWATERPGTLAGVVALAPLAYPELRLEHLLFAPRAAPLTGPLLSRTAALSVDPMLMQAMTIHMFAPQTAPERWRAALPPARVHDSASLTADGEDASWIIPAMTVLSAGYGSCPAPVHFVTGGADQVVDGRRHAARAAGHLPNARLTVLPGVGHMLHHFVPEAAEAALDEVLTRGAAPQPRVALAA